MLNTFKTIISIDPGISGGVSLMQRVGEKINVLATVDITEFEFIISKELKNLSKAEIKSFPNFERKIQTFDNSELVREVYKLIKKWTINYQIDCIVIEKQNPGIQRNTGSSNSGKGKMAMFKTGIMEGIFSTIAIILDIQYIQIASTSWQKIYKNEEILKTEDIKQKVNYRKQLTDTKLKIFSWCYRNFENNNNIISSQGRIIDGITDSIGLGNYCLTKLLY